MSNQADRPITNRSRIDGVDILRGLSIFLVLMNHVHMRLFLAKIPYTDGLPSQLVSSLVWNGQRGVQIFFCISGFLIASTSIKRWGSLPQIKAGAFYWLRFARIVPLFALLLILLSCLHLAKLENFVISESVGSLKDALFAALTFRVNVLEAAHGYLPPNWDILWSLSVEEMFYLFFPIICIFIGRSKKLLITMLALFVVLGPFGRTLFTHGNEVWEEYSYLGSMDAIAFGVLTAFISAHNRFSRSILKYLGGTGILLVGFSLGCTRFARQLGLNQLGIGMTILAIGTCMIIIAATQSKWRAPRIFFPILMLGERSYEIYLTHMFVVIAFFDLFLKLEKPVFMIPVLFLSSIVVSGFLGELVARFYSEPFNSALRRKRTIGSIFGWGFRQPQKVSPEAVRD
jgi:peptidoglycan/LPS O-acetylase OafA/YrhL